MTAVDRYGDRAELIDGFGVWQVPTASGFVRRLDLAARTVDRVGGELRPGGFVQRVGSHRVDRTQRNRRPGETSMVARPPHYEPNATSSRDVSELPKKPTTPIKPPSLPRAFRRRGQRSPRRRCVICSASSRNGWW